MESSLVAISNELASLAGRVGPSIVAVHGRRRTHSSGVHWRKDLVVTAEHTLRRDEDISVTTERDAGADAVLVGRDPGTDIALLRVNNLEAPLAVVSAGKGARVGDLTLVIGRSPNSGVNASAGIISAVSGPWRTWRGGELDNYYRLDAALFAGSSGGAVVDHHGGVMGIATSALSRVAGLAIPATTVERVVDQLLARGSVPQAYLGVGLQPVPMPASFQKKFGLSNSRGVMVLDVENGGSAEAGGILVGDIVLDIEGKGVGSIEDVQTCLGGDKVGKPVRLRLIRGGEMKEVTLTVGERAKRNAP